MCAISGIVRFDAGPPDQNLLRKMAGIAQHRGPDATNIIVRGSVGLAHNRLAIIDINPRGNQPMSYAQRYWIVYNGEIYNYLELRSELEAIGYVFQTQTDTEVILVAYAEWGPACLSRFNGMWAFVIYDEKDRNVFLARDRFGVKPLMISWLPNMLCFGSEIKQLLVVMPNRRANKMMVLDYLITGFENHKNESFFDGIISLPAGTWQRVSLDGRIIDKQKYYNLIEKPEYARLGKKAALETVTALLLDSIRLRLRSDVPVGTSLSGGLDSSLISAMGSNLYREIGGKSFVGIHAKSIDSASDESVFAELVAKNSGIPLVVVEPKTKEFVETIDEVVYTQEEPFGSMSMFMGWQVFREAKKRGLTVMLNGQGSDEAFLGYERYYPIELDPLYPIDFIRRILAQAENSKLTRTDAFYYYFYFRNAFVRISRLKCNRYIQRKNLASFAFDSVRESASSYSCHFAMQKLEIERLQLPHLLRYEDRNSMRHSIETRLPFLDYRLMEVASSLPLDSLLFGGWTKYILRLVSDAYLPRDISWRKVKLGFEAPSNSWFRNCTYLMQREVENSDFLKEFVNLPNVHRDWEVMSQKNRWAFFNLAAWARIYDVSV